MNSAARIFLYLMAAFQAAVGIAALVMPEMVINRFDLMPTSGTGVAEVRGLYGGGILAWAFVILGALHSKPLAPGLLIAMVIIMGSLATARLFSLAVDQEILLNVSAGSTEALTALACYFLYRYEHGTSARPSDRAEDGEVDPVR